MAVTIEDLKKRAKELYEKVIKKPTEKVEEFLAYPRATIEKSPLTDILRQKGAEFYEKAQKQYPSLAMPLTTAYYFPFEFGKELVGTAIDIGKGLVTAPIKVTKSLIELPEVIKSRGKKVPEKTWRFPVLGEITSYYQDVKRKLDDYEKMGLTPHQAAAATILGTGGEAILDTVFVGSLIESGAKALAKRGATAAEKVAAWQFLGYPESVEEANTIRKELAKQFHPDKLGGDERIMAAINDAYKILKESGIPTWKDIIQTRASSIAQRLLSPVEKAFELYHPSITLPRPMLPERAGYVPVEAFKPTMEIPMGLSIKPEEWKPLGEMPKIGDIIDDILEGKTKMRLPSKDVRTDWRETLGKGWYMKIFKSDKYLPSPDEVASTLGMTENELKEEIANRIRLREELKKQFEREVLGKIEKEEGTEIKPEEIFAEEVKPEAPIPPKPPEIPPTEVPPKPPEVPPAAPEPEKLIPPAGKRIRGTWKTIIQPGRAISEALQNSLKLQNPFYDIVPNVEADKVAIEYIQKNGLEKAMNYLRVAKQMDIDRAGMIGGRLIQIYAELGDFEKALEAEKLTEELLRAAGRAAERIKFWSNNVPYLTEKILENYAKQFGKVVPPEIREEIERRAFEILRIEDPLERAKATEKIADLIAAQYPLKFGELFDLYRYTNMLSNPLTHERNSLWNIIATYLGRPTEIFGVKLWQALKQRKLQPLKELQEELPTYVVNSIKAISQAVEAFKNTLKHATPSEKFLERGGITSFEEAIEIARYKRAPTILRIIPDLMEAADKFFTTLIKEGEKARLMAKGMTEGEATAEAEKTAKRLLVRERLGTAKGEAWAVQALDSLGEGILYLRRLPVAGPLASFFIPFVRTPIDVGKEYLRWSPISFIGGEKTDEQMGRALIGTIAMVFGALLALSGRTTWRVPEDPEARALFYASGKKPYSIRILDHWVPMWYFGPLGLSIMIPAMWKYYTIDSEKAYSMNLLEKMARATGDIAYIISELTPLTGMNNFFKAISGDIDIRALDSLGFTFEQIIPFRGALAYIKNIIDPVYRKVTGTGWERFVQEWMRNLPFLSKMLEPYPSPTLEPLKRTALELYPPYAIGTETPEKKRFGEMLKKRIEKLQTAKKIRKEAKEAEEKMFSEKPEDLTIRLQAQAMIDEIMRLPIEKRKEKLAQLIEERPDLVKRMVSIIREKAKTKGDVEAETLRKMRLDERIAYLRELFQKTPPEERGALLEDLISKGVITSGLVKRLRELEEIGSFSK